ncbi:MAG TPA: hypothetical protein VFI65_15570 [Streptosporangiaceae bacterium]|nr:hypothetical protein [Streptosporangiaceae bacterium]
MISCLRTRLATVLVGGALALSLGALTTAAPALAAGPGAAQHGSYRLVPVSSGAAKARPGNTAATCNSTNWEVRLIGSHGNKYLCSVSEINTTGLGPFSELDINAPNRVWLHQNADNSGWADCFSDIGWPDFLEEFSLSGTRDANPGNIQMAGNTTFC